MSITNKIFCWIHNSFFIVKLAIEKPLFHRIISTTIYLACFLVVIGRRFQWHLAQQLWPWAIVVLVLVTMVNCVELIRMLKVQRWQREGRCQTCGYDPRGNRTDICPECGEKREKVDLDK